jgi:hypothetical protein
METTTTKSKGGYEALCDAFESLTNEYFGLLAALPRRGDQSTFLWALFRNALAALFAAHGWTEDEFDAEVEVRLAAAGE